jgi:PAS domain-containing protein
MIQSREIILEESEKALAVVRQLSGAFRRFGEFDQFVAGLESALGKTEFFDRAAIALFPRLREEGSGRGSFPPSTLCLPLAGDDRVLGMLTFSNEQREFGPADLHMMGGLAELVAVMADHALRFGEQRRNLALLSFLLNQVPVGVLCFDEEGRILIGNSLGGRLLGRSLEEGTGELPIEWREEVQRAAGGAFHRGAGGKLLHAVVSTPSSAAGQGVRALVLTDLAPEVDRFREAVAREVYRCAWLGKSAGLILLHAADVGALMGALEPLRKEFSAPAVVAPSGSRTVGILLPESRFHLAMERLRQVRPLLGDDWEAGVATTGGDLKEPGALMDVASAGKRPLNDFLRRSLLLHDDYPSVNDMLEMMLRDRYRLTKSSDFDRTVAYLRTGHFDGLFTEIDLSNGGDGWKLAQVARETTPTIRPFFTTAAAMVRREEERFRGEMVFQKPFAVAELRTSLEAAFA